jgi:hypothetical protein
MVAKGHTGTVIFDGQFVTIVRTGALARMTVGKGEKRIPLRSITAVQWKKPGPFVNGFIAFTVAGGNENRSRLGHQTVDAVHDENSVVVMTTQEAVFLQLRAAIESAIATAHQPVQFPVIAPAPPDVMTQLRQLGELRDLGVVTPEEFEAKKADLLRRL